MKFRDPKTGDVFDGIVNAKISFCRWKDCSKCKMSAKSRHSDITCTHFSHEHPVEAALLMGYEVIADDADGLSKETAKETQTANSPEKSMKVKRDGGKPRLDLVPLECLIPLAKVREFAAQKYGMGSIEAWRDISNDRLFAALLRHLVAAQKGEYDLESGLPAIYHVLCNAAFLAIKEEERQ